MSKGVVECTECRTDVDEALLISHLERHHVGPVDVDAIKIRCGICFFAVSTAKLYLMIQHCQKLEHDPAKISCEWRTFLGTEAERMKNIVVAGAQLFPDYRYFQNDGSFDTLSSLLDKSQSFREYNRLAARDSPPSNVAKSKKRKLNKSTKPPNQKRAKNAEQKQKNMVDPITAENEVLLSDFDEKSFSKELKDSQESINMIEENSDHYAELFTDDGMFEGDVDYGGSHNSFEESVSEPAWSDPSGTQDIQPEPSNLAENEDALHNGLENSWEQISEILADESSLETEVEKQIEEPEPAAVNEETAQVHESPKKKRYRRPNTKKEDVVPTEPFQIAGRVERSFHRKDEFYVKVQHGAEIRIVNLSSPPPPKSFTLQYWVRELIDRVFPNRTKVHIQMFNEMKKCRHGKNLIPFDFIREISRAIQLRYQLPLGYNIQGMVKKWTTQALNRFRKTLTDEELNEDSFVPEVIRIERIEPPADDPPTSAGPRGFVDL